MLLLPNKKEMYFHLYITCHVYHYHVTYVCMCVCVYTSCLLFIMCVYVYMSWLSSSCDNNVCVSYQLLYFRQREAEEEQYAQEKDAIRQKSANR